MAEPLMQYKTFGVELPKHVADVLKLCGAEDNQAGGCPAAIGRIIGVLAHLSSALFMELPPEEYRAFARGTTAGLETLKQIINSANPGETVAALSSLERGKRGDR